MATLNMEGPYPLDSSDVTTRLDRAGVPGNYALGYAEGNTFRVQYVGRSDTCLRDRLRAWCGDGYPRYKYAYASSPKAAFERECHNYHDFGEAAKLRNECHPDRPAGSGWRCPRCSVLG